MSQENVDRLRTIYSEWAKGNFRAGGELLSDDVIFEPMSGGQNAFFGPAAVEKEMREFLGQWEDFRVEAQELAEFGDTVLVTERQHGIGKRSGLEAEMTFFAAWTFRDGLVVGMRWKTDRSRALQAAGLSE